MIDGVKRSAGVALLPDFEIGTVQAVIYIGDRSPTEGHG